MLKVENLNKNLNDNLNKNVKTLNLNVDHKILM
jgi:hypothetical protein